MKVLFVLPNIAVGGVERVRLALIEYFSACGIECRLALRRRRGELLEQACKLVTVEELAPGGLHQLVPSLVRLIKREQPTHVVTAFTDVGALTWASLRLANSRAKWVHTVDASDVMSSSGVWPVRRLRFLLHRRAVEFVYRRADMIVAVSDGVRAEVVGDYAIDSRRIAMLYNPIVPDEMLGWQRTFADRSDRPFRIVAIGRLAHQKGFDILIRALARVPGSWQLSIWGEGTERPKLAELIVELGLQERVQLQGYTSEPFHAMRDSDLFVMPSRYEGLGNVLVEALACQCQIVASDCPHGPREILQDGRLGELVPIEDVDALAGAIERAIAGRHRVSPELLIERARNFSVSESGSQWKRVLRKLATSD